MTASEKSKSLSDAIALLAAVCSDGNFGIHHAFAARVCTLRAHYLWLDERRDEAFGALDDAIAHLRRFEAWQGSYTAPLVHLAEEGAVEVPRTCDAMSLAEDFPWWCVPESRRVKSEMEQDLRWSKWVEKLK